MAPIHPAAAATDRLTKVIEQTNRHLNTIAKHLQASVAASKETNKALKEIARRLEEKEQLDDGTHGVSSAT